MEIMPSRVMLPEGISIFWIFIKNPNFRFGQYLFQLSTYYL